MNPNPWRIPFVKGTLYDDLAAQKRLSDFIKNKHGLAMGEACAQFEAAFQKWQKSRHAILFSSAEAATQSLLQSLRNLGRLEPTSTVGFSSVNWPSTILLLMAAGLRPLALDCDPTTLNVMSEALRTAHRKFPLSALFLSHNFGLTGDVEEIGRFCQKHGVLLVEDCREALGTQPTSRIRLGNFAIASLFAFNPGHQLSTIEGGMVCTNDDETARMVRAMREQFNAKPTEITGFLGADQLAHLEESIDKREATFLEMQDFVTGSNALCSLDRSHLERVSALRLPFVAKTTQLRDEFVGRLRDVGIEAIPLLSRKLNEQPFFRKHALESAKLTGTQILFEQGFVIGNSPELTRKDLQTFRQCLRPLKPKRLVG